MLGTDGVQFIDVRTPAEYRAKHVAGFESRPLDQLDAGAVSPEVVLMCLSGKRASMAAERLEAAGVGGVSVVKGGIQAWEEAGLDVEVGEGVISLERQVRIAAGLMVLIGVILGTWVHPGLYGLAAFVGAGLTFAGITDTCGMGMLLAKAPWNQAGCSCKST
ncbi:rhodanese-like domain-containing protein [Haloferula rosea]|uniref:Rhodanese-like domain-containing protein n=2 Tax=Haloferula rosea TaxID=490093 RepID=A0A934VAE9_9BACT|nr:rhodanese-like domain-containing protein [Haloferula rosea]